MVVQVWRVVLELKLRKIGGSVGVVLPKEILDRFNVAEGDSVFLSDDAEGAVRMTSQRPISAEKKKVMADLSERYRNALRELGK